MEKNKAKETKKKKNHKVLRILAKILLGILILLFLILLFIRSPWGQGIIVDYAVKYVSDKTKTKVEIEKLFITFDGDIMIKGLFLEDKKGDTLVYSKSLEADIPLWPIIRGNGIGVEELDWEGVKANITRKDTIEGYNFQFLMDAFTSADTTSVSSDTSSTKTNIILGDLRFKDIDVVYNDEVLGIDSHFDVGELELEMEKTDLDAMDFRASYGYISNSKIKYIQKPVPVDPNAEPVPLPFLAIEELTIKNVFATYESYADRIAAELEIVDLYAEIPKADLVNNDIEIGNLELKNSIISIHTETENNAITQKAAEEAQKIKEEIQAFSWPEVRFSIAEVDLEKNNLSYFVGDTQSKKGVFNPNAIQLKDLTLQGSDIYLKDKKAKIQIESASLQEFSGFNLKKLAFSAEVTDTNLNVSQIDLALNDNILKGQVQLEYPSLAGLIEAPEKSKIALDIPKFQLDLKEVFKFQPDLRKNEYLSTLSEKYLTGNANASGYLNSVQIPSLNIFWGNTTRISASGMIQNATDMDNLKFNIPQFSARTNRTDLVKFVNESDLGVSLPEDIKLSGTAKGNLEDVYAKANLKTSQGIATIDGHFQYGEQIAFDADLQIKEYQLNKLLNNEQLGSLSLSVKTNGLGKDLNSLDATLDANISSFSFNNYEIKDLAINGNLKDGKGKVVSDYKDRNLNVELNAGVIMDSIAPEINMNLNVIGADLQALGLMQRNVRTGLILDADFKGNLTDFDVISTIGEGVVVYDNKTYLLGDVLATAHVRQDTTSIWLDNKMVQLQLESNTDPSTFATAIQRHIASYFYRDEKVPDTIKKPVKLGIKGKIIQSPVLNEVFLVNVKDLDTVSIAIDFNEIKRKLKANITAPHINYGGNEIDSLAFSMDTDKDKFVFDLGFNEINAGPLSIKRTEILGNQTNNELALDFIAYHEEEKMIQIKSKISGSRERLRFHVIPSDLIIQKEPWKTPENNEVIITDKKLEFNNFKFSRNNQSVAFSDKLPLDKDHVGIEFKNFELSEFLNYLNPDKEFAQGNMNGSLVIEDLFGSAGLLADLDIKKLNIMDVEMGTLSVDAKSLGGNSYDFNADMKGGDIDLSLTGDYVATETESNLNLDLDINKFNMKALEGFSQGEIIETGGSFKGNFDVNGTLAEPKYDGSLTFNDAKFKVASFNAAFSMENEKLNVDNSGISMNNFTVRDENKNTLVLSGKVGTETFINPTFDLSVKAENFQVLNATKDDNDFLYGQLAFDADAKVTGDLEIPVVDMKLDVSSNTDVTYVMPSSTVNIEERDGVVIFVNRENPDAILTRTEEKTATITGFDISALLKIGKDAKVTIIIDQETGDNFQVYGEGDFNFDMNPNGRMNLTGVYEVSGGHYEMNLYNLVNRKFELAEGSRVSWSGDPFDAKLDVRAIYRLEASASPLMGPQISGSDPSVKSKFRQVLPFYVYLNVDGELMAPKISFNLDMPEDEQGAIGGQVYGRVQQVNQQEGELNRQVFSLLVLNRFYPEPGSDGSRGGFASIARDNLNDALSDQLNVFSDKLLGDTGVELDFGLDSYTDYQGDSPQERTQLDIAARKKLFNDRLIVSVGSEVDIQGSSTSNEATPLIGNVSLEYILTNNGRYRIKGFRRNEFENVIDGQTIVSGIALIFTQEFNKFSELWDALVKSETKEKRKEEERVKRENEAREKKTDEEMEEKSGN